MILSLPKFFHHNKTKPYFLDDQCRVILLKKESKKHMITSCPVDIRVRIGPQYIYLRSR